MNRVLLQCLAALGMAAAAHAQKFEIGGFGSYARLSQSPLGSTSREAKQDNDTTLKFQRAYGGRLTYNSPGYYGHELSYWVSTGLLKATRRETVSRQVVTTTTEDSIKVHNAGYNFLIYFMPSGEKWRPFITGGVHAQQYDEPKFEFWDRGRSRNYGANYGAGIKLIPAKHVLFRLDVRHYIGGKPWDLEFADFGKTGGLLGTLTASAGFSITF